MKPRWITVAVSLLLAACGSPGDGSVRYFHELIDDDGIPVVESGSEPFNWTGTLPVLVLDEVTRVGDEGGPEDQLLTSRWQAVDVAPDGSVGHLERSPTELRVYRPDGELAFRAGRAGEGPGEWRYGSVLDHVDGLGWAVSAIPSRLVLLSETGELIETVALGGLPGRPMNSMEVTAEGGLWYFAEQSVTWGEHTASLVRANWKTLEVDTVHTSLRYRQVRVEDFGLSYQYPQSISLGPQGRVWVNTSLDYEIEVFGISEEGRMRVRRDYDPIPDPLQGEEPEDPDSYSAMQNFRRIYPGHHEVLPAIRSLEWVDGEELWVFTSIETDTSQVQVDVFDAEGRYLRAFSAPAGLIGARWGIAAGHIWWLRPDESGLPILFRYRYRLENRQQGVSRKGLRE